MIKLNQPIKTKEKQTMKTVTLQLNVDQYDLLKNMVEDYLNEVSNIAFIAPSDKLAKKRLEQFQDLEKAIAL